MFLEVFGDVSIESAISDGNCGPVPQSKKFTRERESVFFAVCLIHAGVVAYVLEERREGAGDSSVTCLQLEHLLIPSYFKAQQGMSSS